MRTQPPDCDEYIYVFDFGLIVHILLHAVSAVVQVQRRLTDDSGSQISSAVKIYRMDVVLKF